MTKVKICGLSRTEDAKAVNCSLPDYCGFVFAESSRRVDADTAAKLKKELDSSIEAVGVFVNEDIEVISKLYSRGTIDMVQLHGDEDALYIERLKDSCGCRVIKSIAVGDTVPPIPDGPEYLLFDSMSVRRGGTGRTFDWNIIKDFAGTPYFLAGGLDSANVRDAVRSLSPYCVDVSGGVETDGKKDAGKIEDLIRVVKEAD